MASSRSSGIDAHGTLASYQHHTEYPEHALDRRRFHHRTLSDQGCRVCTEANLFEAAQGVDSDA
jgi:hypothetical protein